MIQKTITFEWGDLEVEHSNQAKVASYSLKNNITLIQINN